MTNDEIKYSPYFRNSLIMVVSFEDEVFKPWPADNRFWVSNYGRVFDHERKLMKKTTLLNSNYMQCKLSNDKKYPVHRMVLETFCPREDSRKLYVNHKNFIRNDNRLQNLEWCTPQYNSQYTVDKKKYMIGENNNKANYTNQQINEICKLLEQNNDSKFVANKIGIKFDLAFSRLCTNLRKGKTWRSISQNYNLNLLPRIKYTENEINKICKLMEQGLSYKEIEEKLGIYNPNFAKFYSAILHGRIYKNISSKFNFPINHMNNTYNLKTLETMCILYKGGKSYGEISDILKIPKSKVSGIIYSIKSGKAHCDLKKKFGI